MICKLTTVESRAQAVLQFSSTARMLMKDIVARDLRKVVAQRRSREGFARLRRTRKVIRLCFLMGTVFRQVAGTEGRAWIVARLSMVLTGGRM